VDLSRRWQEMRQADSSGYPPCWKSGGSMAQWEYQFLIAEKHGKGIFGFVLPQDISWKIHYVNGRQQTNWAEITLYNYLNKMGKEGWEVATQTSHVTIRTGTLPVEHLYIILKRQLENGEKPLKTGTESGN
jgi:hypothetical protein